MTEALVLAHGAFHGPWCWRPTISRLEKEGIRCVPVDLNRGGLDADRDALQVVVDRLREEHFRVHAIGHSLGCCSVTALSAASLATITLLAGPAGEGGGLPAASELIEPGFLDALLPQDDGRSFISREDASAAFYHRCSEDEAKWALDRLRPTFVYGARATSPLIWESIPVTYVGCSDDRAVRPEYQRAAVEQMPFGVMLDSDHSPMLGAPDALAGAVLESMARA